MIIKKEATLIFWLFLKKLDLLKKLKIKTGIFNEMEEQKLDLVVKKDFNDVFVQMIENDLQCL